MESPATEAIARLEERLQAVTDRLEIMQLIASYGPSVDSGAVDETAAIWEEDGVFEFSPLGDTPEEPRIASLDGREEIRAMVAGDDHQTIIGLGSAHYIGMPAIRIRGDEAMAINYTLLIQRHPESGENVLERVCASKWVLRRGAEGWRVRRRSQILLDGRGTSRDILREAAGQFGL